MQITEVGKYRMRTTSKLKFDAGKPICIDFDVTEKDGELIVFFSKTIHSIKVSDIRKDCEIEKLNQ